MKVFWFLITFFSLLSSFAQEITIHNNDYLYGTNKVLHFSGESKNWNHKSILSHLPDFKLIQKDLVALPPSDNIDWLYFNLFNPDSNDLWVNLGSDRLNKIVVFKLNSENEIIDSLVSGFENGIDYRPWGEFEFWMPLLNRKEYSGNFLIGFYSKHNNHDFRPCFGARDKILENSRNHFAISMFYAGIMLIMIFYHSIIAFTLWDRTYALYSLNLAGIFLVTSYGVHFPVISHLIGEACSHNYFSLWVSVIFILVQLFTTSYFDLARSAPKWHKTLTIISYLTIINGLMIFIVPAYIPNSFVLLLVITLYIVCTLIGISQIKKKHPLASLYVLVWIIIFCGFIIFFFAIQVETKFNGFTYYINYITSSLEAAIFSIALGKRYRLIMEKEKETAKLLSVKNSALLLANKSLDSFNYHVSHDLKSVLVNTGSLNKMIKKYAKKGDINKVLDIGSKLDEVVDKGQNTINGFLSLGKSLTASDQSLDKINIKQKILEIASNHGLDNLEIKIVISEFDFLHINKTAFESIFLNLMTNSIKYCVKKPVINLSMYESEDNLLIIYTDNGIGINLTLFEEDLFSPFKKVENNLNQEGSGVGLYLVKRIITNYGGTITPSSIPGKGLTFMIQFPKNKNGTTYK